MELHEYRRMAAVEATHWWYRATRSLLGDVLGPLLPDDGALPEDAVRPDGALLLDAGGGTGATGAWMAGRGHVVASDFEPIALPLYRELHPDVAAFAAADVQRLPFRDGAFDAALCVTVLYHQGIASPAAAVAELARVVRPGGVVCLMEPGVRRLFRAHDREVHGARRFSLGDLRAALTVNGLRVERATGAYSFLVPPAAVKAVIERGASASDLENNAGGLGGTLALAARAERALLRRASLPFGLSVLAVGRKP